MPALLSRPSAPHGKGGPGGKERDLALRPADPPAPRAPRPSGAAVPQAQVSVTGQPERRPISSSGRWLATAATPPRPLEHPGTPPTRPPSLPPRSLGRDLEHSVPSTPRAPAQQRRDLLPSPGGALTGLGRVAVHGIGRDVHLLHARVLPASQGAHGRCARAALGVSPGPIAPRPERGSAAPGCRLGLGLGVGAAAQAAGSPRRAAHHPPPGPAAAPLSRGLRVGRGRRRLRPRDVSGDSARGPRWPRPMVRRGGSGRAAPANERRDAAERRPGSRPGRGRGPRARGPAEPAPVGSEDCAEREACEDAPHCPPKPAVARGFPAGRQPPTAQLSVCKADGRNPAEGRPHRLTSLTSQWAP